MTKDNFSSQASDYAKYRPHYPKSLYHYLFKKVDNFDAAWDCGTGNGQVAIQLAEHFKYVYGTDISQNQLDHAPYKDNICYLCTPVEKTPLQEESVNLVTVGQAIHWFDLVQFYQEVQRVAKPNALMAYWAYGLVSVSEEIDPLIKDFHDVTVGPYWDEERKIWANQYADINFPLKKFEKKKFTIELDWSVAQLHGYLSTWSSVRKYMHRHKNNPVGPLIDQVSTLWTDKLKVRFPVLVFTGYVN